MAVWSDQDTTLDGVPVTISWGPYWIGDVQTAFGGRDPESRSLSNQYWTPFYDAPLGTWTLLRTPKVAVQVRGDHQAPMNGVDVHVNCLLAEPLVQSINPHVFEVSDDIPNDLAYLLTIRGDIDPINGLTRVDDTLYLTEPSTASCAGMVPYQLSFRANGDYTITGVRVALTPTLTPRNKLDSVRVVRQTKFLPAQAVLVDRIQPMPECNGIHQATEHDVVVACEQAHSIMAIKTIVSPSLPAIDTLYTDNVRSEMFVRPNPTSGSAHVEFQTSVDEEIFAVYVVDILGKRYDVVSDIHPSATYLRIVLQMGDLSSDLYTIVVETSKGVRSAPVIKVR